ncbi:MAG TPA: hypothetical protein VJG32_18070 [Anaerolineae bacterium]|nr:hypothetical protein [Anaerolineae bacterium]
MILSFAWTTPQYQSGKKKCTRRMWSDDYLALWQKAWDEGRLVHDAYDRLPRIGGQRIGKFRLTCRPYRERLADMPEEDIGLEGGLWASKEEFIELFGGPELMPAVIRFEQTE